MRLGKPMDVAAMLGGVLGGNWALGMLMHLVNGIVIFPLLYAYLVSPVVPGQPWVKGAVWGVILWLVLEVIVTPMMGGGLFSAKAGGAKSVMVALIGHVVYGVLLGGVAGAAQRRATAAAH